MGQIEAKGGNLTEKITINHFDLKHVIGRGGFGKVWKVVCKKNGKEYAMKVMSKVKIIDRKSQKSILSERHLLSKLCNPFLVNMVYSFQDQDHLYLVMDLLTGGDLRYHISRHKAFTQEQTKFFLACLILGLEYIHDHIVIHRDIKPENLVCDDRGYIRITDFGVAKKYKKDNASETSGTPGYMAPEVLCSQNHSFPVDYFALGVIGYEFMLGRRPYHGKSRKEVKQDVLNKQVQIKISEMPQDWSKEGVNFVNLLIQRKPSQRLGYNGISEIKNHPWLKDFPWSTLTLKEYESPFIPVKGDNFDKHYCDGEDKIGESTKERYFQYRKSETYESVFNKYTYNNIPKEEYTNYNNNINTTTRQANSTNHTMASSNSTLASINKSSSTKSIKDINSIDLGSIGKLKLKPNDSYFLNKTKTPFNCTSIQAQMQKNSMIKMKASFLSPSALLYNNSSFYFADKNLPMIQSSSSISNNKKQIIRKSSSTSQFMSNGKNQTIRPQTFLNNTKDNHLQYIINGPMNVRQVNFSNNQLMGSTLGALMGEKQFRRNKSSTVLNVTGYSSNRSSNIH